MEQPKPPKPPTTEQGAEIVESILAAAELVLEQDGFARFTTNWVAERAGVSVGSFYQYFPNKQAVLAELARRLERRTEDRLARVLADSRELSLEQVVARVLDALSVDLGGLEFRRVLQREVPNGWKADTSREVDATIQHRVRDILASRRDIRRGDHDVMAWVLSHAI